MKHSKKMSFFVNINENTHQVWLKKILAVLQSGIIMIDTGVGELKKQKALHHQAFLSQDFWQEIGLKTTLKDIFHIDLVNLQHVNT